MGQLKSFASTSIAASKTRDDLERMLAKRGIKASRWTHLMESGDTPGSLIFEFEWQKQPDSPLMGFRLSLSYKGEAGPKGGKGGTSVNQAARGLFWHIKNLFDSVDFGINEMEQAFMPYLLVPGEDRTVWEKVGRDLAQLPSGNFITGLLPPPPGSNRD